MPGTADNSRHSLLTPAVPSWSCKVCALVIENEGASFSGFFGILIFTTKCHPVIPWAVLTTLNWKKILFNGTSVAQGDQKQTKDNYETHVMSSFAYL